MVFIVRDVGLLKSQNNITRYPEYPIYSDSFNDNPTIQNNQLKNRIYPYRTYTGYDGNIRIIEQGEVHALQHTGNSKYNSTNIIQFEDGSTNYTAEFDFKIISMSPSSDRVTSINLWILRGANDGLSYTSLSLSFKTNNVTTVSIITYNLGKSAWTTTETILKTGLTEGQIYHVKIVDTGRDVTLHIDETIILQNVDYIPFHITPSIPTPLSIPPGYYKGFGANENNIGTWTNIRIIPTEKNPKFFGKNNHFILPSSSKRNQPLHLEYIEYGGGIQYSQTTYPNTGGIFLMGPSNLTHYTGLISRITIQGDYNTTFEISGIDYQYTP